MKIYRTLYLITTIVIMPLLHAAASEYTRDDFRIFCAMMATAQSLRVNIAAANKAAQDTFQKSEKQPEPDQFYVSESVPKTIDPRQEISITQGLLFDKDKLLFHTPWGRWDFAQGLSCKTKRCITKDSGENPMATLLEKTYAQLDLQAVSIAHYENEDLYMVTHFNKKGLPALLYTIVGSIPDEQPVQTSVAEKPRGWGSYGHAAWASLSGLFTRKKTADAPIAIEMDEKPTSAATPVAVDLNSPELLHERRAKWQAMYEEYNKSSHDSLNK